MEFKKMLTTINKFLRNVIHTLNKGKYMRSVNSLLIFIIFALLLFFLYKFKSSNSISKSSIKKMENMENELEEVKKKSRTKEQELMRKLQDEINKNL